MGLLRQIQNIAWYGSVLAEIVLALHLFRSGLFKKYRAFSVYLAIGAMRSCVLIWIGYNTTHYWRFWSASEIFVLGLEAAAVLEIYLLTMSNYRAKRTEWAYLLVIALTLAVGGSLGLDFFNGNGDRWDILMRRQFLERWWIIGILLLFSVLAEWHHRYLPPPTMPANLLRHRVIMLWYLIQAAILQTAIYALGPRSVVPIATAALLVSVGCFVAWTRALQPSGEWIESSSATQAERDEVEARSAAFESFMRSHPPVG